MNERQPTANSSTRREILQTSFPAGGVAMVIGATGAVGAALTERLSTSANFTAVVGLSRTGSPALELTSEQSIQAAAAAVIDLGLPLRLVFDATGFLHDGVAMPEKTWRDLNADRLAHAFAVNTIGPALLMKYFLPLLARDGKSVFATLSARVGSIGDNQLGGWYGYRASKAALNQMVRCAAIELKRSSPSAICVALHPGTVESSLSAPFERRGLDVRPPGQAADELLAVIESLTADDTGSFLDHLGKNPPW
jgi:NAD(P)-dependent dehydrogenase (short-subunit alcohol dehydrogenase family)